MSKKTYNNKKKTKQPKQHTKSQPEFISFQSWSTKASLHKGDSMFLVKGGFLVSISRILCLKEKTSSLLNPN